MWIDQEFLSQLTTALGEASEGIKMRFTHPGLSSDGMGKFLGRAKGATLEGDKVRTDLHFAESAHRTPDGDLAEYVMMMAMEDPDMFGTSIVFERDFDAEEEFYEAHRAEVKYTDTYGEEKTRKVFKSPDPDNTKNLMHARLSHLQAVDVVDQPAANPDGLFHRKAEFAQEGTALLDYVVGRSDQAPKLAALSIDADRAQEFLHRYLNQNGLEIAPIDDEEEQMSEKTTPETSDDNGTDALQAERERVLELSAEFSGDFLTESISEGWSLNEAKAQKYKELQAQNDQLKQELEQLKQEQQAEDDGVDFAEAGDDDWAEFDADNDDSVELQAKKVWKKDADIRDEFGGKFELFHTVFKRHPNKYSA